MPQARFVFVGPLDTAATGWFENTDPRIMYLGKVSAQEKADALSACDVFCMPSRSEILPTVYLEAWSYGKAVVGGQAHGLPELVEGNRAGLSVSQEPAQVANALHLVLENKELRDCLGQHGQELVADKYSVPAVTGALEALYRKLTS